MTSSYTRNQSSDEQQASAVENPEYERVKRKLRHLRRFAFLGLHGRYRRFLFALGIGWWVSKQMCRFGIYQKFTNGRCMYCGETH